MNTEGYTKLASSILTSTVWVESDRTLRVWIAILALADRNGFVSGTVPGLASVARVPVEDCRTAVTKFLEPDQDSRSKEHEGRRLKEVDGGWFVLNHRKYRNDRDPDSRREQTRRAVAKHRAKLSQDVSHSKPHVSQSKPQKAQSESEAPSEARGINAPRKKFPSEAIKAIRIIEEDIQHLKDYGKRDADGKLTAADAEEFKRLREDLKKNKRIACEA